MASRVIVSLYLFFLPTFSIAAPIYKATDATGRTVYTSKPSSPSATPAALPPITRNDQKFASATVETCQKHGGVNCQAGPDTDGSVICFDGFRGAITRFRVSCATPKLEITGISDLTPDGSFTVYIRNSKSVEATNPRLLYRPDVGVELDIPGPKSIEAFGAAEFTYEPRSPDGRYPQPDAGKIDVTCANCP